MWVVFWEAQNAPHLTSMDGLSPVVGQIEPRSHKMDNKISLWHNQPRRLHHHTPTTPFPTTSIGQGNKMGFQIDLKEGHDKTTQDRELDKDLSVAKSKHYLEEDGCPQSICSVKQLTSSRRSTWLCDVAITITSMDPGGQLGS